MMLGQPPLWYAMIPPVRKNMTTAGTVIHEVIFTHCLNLFSVRHGDAAHMTLLVYRAVVVTNTNAVVARPTSTQGLRRGKRKRKLAVSTAIIPSSSEIFARTVF